MWRKLPLNAKLIASLLVVQTSALLVGVAWLTGRTESTLLDELRQRLDTQGDVIEGTIKTGPKGLVFDGGSETARELADDKDFYFLLLKEDGSILAESARQPAELRLSLRGRVRPGKGAAVYEVTLPTGTWLVQSEPHLRGFIHVAINAQPVLDDVAAFRRLIAGGALGILLVTSLGSGLVVSFSTRNIRAFAHRIRKLRPPHFDGRIDLAPQSAEEALLFDSYDQLIRAVRASGESQRLFIAHASHELKTPIAAALAALEVTLMRPRSAADYEQTCRDVLGEVTALRRLSTLLLDLALLDADPRSQGDAACDPAAVAAAVLARWRKPAEERQVMATLLVGPEVKDARVAGAAEQWEVVLGNLVDNAIKYGKSAGFVAVTLGAARGDLLELSIRDDGRGMTPAELDRLGDLFFRADVARSGGESFGLGFAHAKRIVERLGGTLSVESRPGAGTTVLVRAPRIRLPAGAAPG